MELRWIDEVEAADYVEVVPGVRLAGQSRCELRDYHGYDVDAALTVSTDPIGINIDSLTVFRRPDGPPISSEGIRKIKVQSFIHMAVRVALRDGLGRDIPEGSAVVALGAISVDEAERLRVAGPTLDTLVWVSRIYQLAELTGDPPTRTVEVVFRISRSTAGAWIGRARSAGLLPPVGDNDG